MNKLDGLPFTQQDEFLIRGAATEVAVMLEAARAASDASTASQHLSVLTAFADTLGSLEGGREDPKFEAFLEEEFRKSVACDSFATFWHVPEQGVLLGPDGHTVHQGDLDTLPPPNTPATPEAMTATDDRHVLSSFVEKKTLVVAGPLSVLCVPVISQTEPTSPCLGIITVTGGPKRAKATGGTTFTRAEKRLLEDLAAHVAVWLDIQAVDTGLSSHRSNVSILKAL